MSSPNYKAVQKAQTELNADGNENRGREGEELNPYSRVPPAHFAEHISEEEWKAVVEALHFNGEADR